jgi:hypothetical protein
MPRQSIAALVLVSLAAAAVAAPVMIPGVKGIEGSGTGAIAFTRALNAGFGAKLPDPYLEGFSGIAFLATVCQNNCLCRDYREADVRLAGAVRALGYDVTHLDGGKTVSNEKAWALIRSSLDRGVPAVAFNLFGGWQDAPLVGIDEGKDLLWGMQPGRGDEPRSTSLSTWRSADIWGYVIGPEVRKDVDRRALELERLLAVVAAAYRPILRGG